MAIKKDKARERERDRDTKRIHNKVINMISSRISHASKKKTLQFPSWATRFIRIQKCLMSYGLVGLTGLILLYIKKKKYTLKNLKQLPVFYP